MRVLTDGSSTQMERHNPDCEDMHRNMPMHLDSQTHAAMIVLGEKIMPDGLTIVEPIGWFAQPVHYDPLGACYTHAERIGAEVAEREALIWAGIWRLSQDSSTPTIYCCDSLSCGKQAFGYIGVESPDEAYRLLRGVFQCLEHGLPRGHLALHHTRSHAGDPYNEFVDLVAKREAQSSFHLNQVEINMQKWHKIFPHLWLVFGQRAGLPQWQDGTLATEVPQIPSLGSLQTSDRSHATEATLKCAISFATANVLSLSRGPDGHSGKLHYLFDQMHFFRLNVLGLQECRSDEGFTTSHSILRFMSGQRQGQGGVELWINLKQPIAHDPQGQPVHFHEHHFQVVFKDHRRLLVKVESKVLDGWFFVAHAPHSGRPRDEREDWWQQTSQILAEHTTHEACVWMIDANAEPGNADDSTVFSRGLRTSANTILFRDCLQQHELCLPSTSSIHQGSRDTWTKPDGGDTFCIDYVAVPTSWKDFCTWSQVLHEFDLATTREDHKAVGLEITWWQHQVLPPARTKRTKLTNLLQLDFQKLRDTIQEFEVSPWSADVEKQERTFRQQLHSCLQQQCELPISQPKKSYINPEIWQMRQKLLKWQKKLKQVRKSLKFETLWTVWKAWRKADPSTTGAEQFNYGTSLRCDSVLIMAHFRACRFNMRRQLKQTKAKAVENCLQHINEHTAASNILRMLRPFVGPTNPKKQKSRTLPMLDKSQGESCRTPEEARDQWIKFFADMEGGQRQTLEQLRGDWIDTLEKEDQPGFVIHASSLPTLVDLELAFRKVACGKAIGPDEVPGEVCHYAPAACARANFSALWKLALFGHEALCYKGGLLVQAYKGKGATTQCSSYRSLLISSHIGKSIHRTLRSTQASAFEHSIQAQQLGGRRAMPVTYGVHLVRAFQRQAKHAGTSCALIMLDLKEAFYRIFRPLCMDGKVTDDAIAALMQRLQMPHDALEVLRNLIKEPCALQQAGMDWRQQRSVRAVHSQTHFWMHQQQDVVHTSHGSGPGDPFADIIFSYVWAIVLHKLQFFMQSQEILSAFPHRPSLSLFAVDEPEQGRFDQFVGPTWMDDLCVCVEGPSPEILLRNAGLAIGKLLELCTEHCMTPNLQRNKTEVLLSLRGTNSRHFKKKLFGPDATGQLSVINEYGAYQVPVTHRYCHLGGLLHHAADQKAEIRRRIAIAHSTVSQHRKLVFRNWQLSLQKRTQLFESLVLSRLLYGAKTWVAMDDKTERTFHAAIIRLYRRLLPIAADQHLSDEAILSQVLLPSPSELLRRARLRYVATLLHCGERQEWGLLEKIDPGLFWLKMTCVGYGSNYATALPFKIHKSTGHNGLTSLSIIALTGANWCAEQLNMPLASDEMHGTSRSSISTS